MRNRIGLAITCLQISAVIYMLLGFGLLFYGVRPGATKSEGVFGIVMTIGNLLIVAGIEFLVKGIKRRRFWAWITGLCVFGIYTCSIFLPLGVLGLWGLIDRGSRNEFGISVQKDAT